MSAPFRKCNTAVPVLCSGTDKDKHILRQTGTPPARPAGIRTMRTRVFLVDDTALVRATLRALLEQHSFDICGEASNGKEAIEKVIELNPDIVILDINMPVMNGVRAAVEIRRIAPETAILFLTAHAIPGVMHALRRFSDGFVCKTAVGHQLIPTLGRIAITPHRSRRPAFRVASAGRSSGA
jgi:CheY-like chemotaxis protein